MTYGKKSSAAHLWEYNEGNGNNIPQWSCIKIGEDCRSIYVLYVLKETCVKARKKLLTKLYS